MYFFILIDLSYYSVYIILTVIKKLIIYKIFYICFIQINKKKWIFFLLKLNIIQILLNIIKTQIDTVHDIYYIKFIFYILNTSNDTVI